MIVSAGRAAFDVDMVIFDKDGTLIDLDLTWGPLGQAWLSAVAGDEPGLKAALAVELGVGPDGTLVDGGSMASESVAQINDRTRRVLQAHGHDGEAAAARVTAASTAMEGIALELYPIGDVRGAMERLASAGLILAVASSDDADQIFSDLRTLGVADLVAAVAAGDGPWDPKPDPASVLALAATFELEPSRILMVGDSHTDIGAARRAGAAGVVAVARPDGTCVVGSEADAVITSIEELSVW